jgi:hypothetical protein
MNAKAAAFTSLVADFSGFSRAPCGRIRPDGERKVSAIALLWFRNGAWFRFASERWNQASMENLRRIDFR